jgi:hypothetical protein
VTLHDATSIAINILLFPALMGVAALAASLRDTKKVIAVILCFLAIAAWMEWEACAGCVS